MAVYTHLTEDEIAAHLKHYDLGALVNWHEIPEGVENSNYYIETDRDRYILTLFEKRVDRKDLPFFISLMEHMEGKEIVCPLPIKSIAGEIILEAKGRPAVIISFLEGKGVRRVRNDHMLHLGEIMGKMHCAVDDFDMARPNTMSLDAWKSLAAEVVPRADEITGGLGKLIEAEIIFLEEHWPKDLPAGVIHADLFPDNVFYRDFGAEVRLSGVIDFYFACNDFYMYDLAIAINAWCFENLHHEFNITRTSKLLKGYNNVCPITPEEYELLPILARGAAMRFLLTRCYDWLNPASEALVKPKDPREYLRKLQFHQQVKNSGEYGL